MVSAIVVGGGPAGIAVLGNLLKKLPPEKRIAWVDPHFDGGRINPRYREVPSNTKVELFLKYARGVGPLNHIVQTTPTPNAVTALEELPQDETCSLSYAGDLLKMLSDGLRSHDRVEPCYGIVSEASRQNEEWSLTVNDSTSGKAVAKYTAPLVAYCTGSFPTTIPLPTAPGSNSPALLDLDTVLKPSALSEHIPKDKPVTVGVIGASHSAILVLMNLCKLAQTTHGHLGVRWFSRSPSLHYAVYKDGWILYDNTGLKGKAAQFAREQLDGDRLHTSEAGAIISRVDCSGGAWAEREAMLRDLPACDYVVQAIGFTRAELPAGMDREMEYDHETGGFVDAKSRDVVPGLFGAGIAFPARVVDPVGNVEYAVGFYKFMKFLKKVVPTWVSRTHSQ